MIIIPAIDLKDGQCVRLRKGVMEDTTVFSNNPTEMASKWVEEGARRLHLVDLNGAFEGRPINADCINEITNHSQNCQSKLEEVFVILKLQVHTLRRELVI